jgi:UDP-GlcNAc:undecaprenyl-phosphate GlcNAc-1-phosphate transferase
MAVVFFLIPLTLTAVSRGRLAQRGRELHHTHDAPVPRLGGLALAAAFLVIEVVITFCYPDQQQAPRDRLVILLSSLAMFGLGFWDDLRPLGAKRKLLGQLVIAAVVCAYGIGIQTFKIPFTGKIFDLSGWGVLITLMWLVGMTNLINLVDGVDGLAGGICLMLMALLAYQGNSSLQLLAAGMAGALLAFLWFNFPPARIYLGDGGAYFLGFQLGLFSIASSQKGTLVAALVAPLFVLALPIVDVSLAILRRGLRGLPIFRPDKRHLHHHLINMGLSRREVVLSIYAVTLVFLLMGFAAFWSRGQLVPVLLGLAGLVLLLCAGKLSFSREWFAVGRVLGNSLGMRQEVQYALCLTRWLELEGNRRASLENLWLDFVFVAQRLGFTSVKLTLADGFRSWELPNVPAAYQFSRQELLSGHCGILELAAPSTQTVALNPNASSATLEDGDTSCPCLADRRLFQIMAELMAEGWLNATKRWDKSASKPLRFDSKLAGPQKKSHRRSRTSLSSPPAAAPNLIEDRS